MHKQLSEEAINRLKALGETSKLVLYGSVARGDFGPNADIDIAFICSDELRGLPLDIEGLPLGLRQNIDNMLDRIQNPNKIQFHVPVYWESEFTRGIELFSGKRNPPDLLHEVGILKYDALSECRL